MSEPAELVLTSPLVAGGHSSHEHWPTPSWVTTLLADHAEREGWWGRGEAVLDPCAGEGALLDVLHKRGLDTYGIELDPERARRLLRAGHHQHGVGDALSLSWRYTHRFSHTRFPLIVTNPPFSLGEAIVRKGLAERPPRGMLVCLLRLSWLEPTSTRGELLRATRPDVLILPRRPHYDQRGSDSVTSAWFVWPGSGQITWLPAK